MEFINPVHYFSCDLNNESTRQQKLTKNSLKPLIQEQIYVVLLIISIMAKLKKLIKCVPKV